MMFKGRSLSFEHTFKMNVNTILLIFLKLYFSESVLLVWVLKKIAQFPGKIAQLVKCFQKKKHENLSLGTQNPQKSQE